MGSDGTTKQARQVTITLAGSTYTIKTDATEEYVNRLEQYVNDKLDIVQPGGQRLAPRTAVALAALSIADDYFSATERQSDLAKTVRERLGRLLARIDAALGPEKPAADE